MNHLFLPKECLTLPLGAHESRFVPKLRFLLVRLGDMSAYRDTIVQISCANTTSVDLDIAGVYLECWYA